MLQDRASTITRPLLMLQSLVEWLRFSSHYSVLYWY